MYSNYEASKSDSLQVMNKAQHFCHRLTDTDSRQRSKCPEFHSVGITFFNFNFAYYAISDWMKN